MKLTVKYNGRRNLIELCNGDDSPPTLNNLTLHLQSLFCICDDLQLSLNGSDILQDSPETKLSDLGIVSGDILFVLNPCKKQPDEPKASAKRQSTTEDVQPSCSSKSYEKEDCGKSDISLNPTSDQSQEGGSKDGKDEAMEEEDPDTVQDADVNRYLHEPIQVCESTSTQVPHQLQIIYNRCEPQSDFDALCVVLHVLLMETGYVLLQKEGQTGNIKDWKNPAGYKICYTHSSQKDVSFVLSIIPMGKVAVIHGLLQGSSQPCSCKLQLKVSDYISTQIGTDAVGTYKCLPLLSRIFKDAISNRLLLSVNTGENSSVQTLDTLVLEVQLMILKYLKASDLSRLSQTCKVMQDVCSTPSLWRRLYLLDFGRRIGSNDLSQNWKGLYKNKHIMRSRQREAMRNRMMVPPPFGVPNPPLPFAPVYPPGFVGGDYDRDPHFGGMPGFGPHPSPLVPRPRFDQIFGPGVPNRMFRPGRGGGFHDPYLPGSGGRRGGGFGGGGMGGPRFF